MFRKIPLVTKQRMEWRDKRQTQENQLKDSGSPDTKKQGPELGSSRRHIHELGRADRS